MSEIEKKKNEHDRQMWNVLHSFQIDMDTFVLKAATQKHVFGLKKIV